MGKQTQRGQLVWPTSHDKLEAGPVSLPDLCSTPRRAGLPFTLLLCRAGIPSLRHNQDLGAYPAGGQKQKKKKNFAYTADKCNADTVTPHAVIPYLLETQDGLAKVHCVWDPDQYIDMYNIKGKTDIWKVVNWEPQI